jgi:hypothetical protein
MIHTDSKITLESLKNRKNQNQPIEEIRKKTIELEKDKLGHRIHLNKGTRRTLWK